MSRPTIVVFARAPIPGQCKTRLAASLGAEPAARLYEAMLLDTLDNASAIKDARLVLLAAPENDGARILQRLAPPDWEVVAQVPGDLTARLLAAFETFGADNSTVVCLGSDAPTAPLDAVARALQECSFDVMIGDSRDGGYWAIGMRTLVRGLLVDMPWSTDRVASETRQRCSALGLTVLDLPVGFDVDASEDLPLLADTLRNEPAAAPRTARLLASR